MNWQEIGIIISLSITTIGAIFVVYDRFTKPDIKTGNEVNVMQERCRLTHSGLDKDIKGINESISSIQRSFTLLQENDLKHIETRMTDLEKGQIEIKTILSERLPKKNA